MIKKILFIILFLTCPALLFSEPSMILNGPYGGTAEISCGEIYTIEGQDTGGECNVNYIDYSTIPGWKFNGGPIEIGFSDLGSYNQIWVDFFKFSSVIKLTNDDGTTTMNIENPEKFSFQSERSTLHCIKVIKYTGEGSPTLKVNGVEVPVEPEFLHYFLHIFN